MERIGNQKPFGLSRQALRTWGLLFVAAGVVGEGILQNRTLGLGSVTTTQLLEAMQGSDNVMFIATMALVLQVMETCAVPIFAFLLVEGWRHTSDFKQYMIRVAGVALLSEIPYNLAISGKILDFSTRNPVFGLVLSMIALYLFCRYPGKNVKNVLIKLVVTVAAMLWAPMLRIEGGGCMVLIVSALWLARKKPMMQNLLGATAAIVCSLSSPFYMASPMVFLAIHFHNGEPGNSNRMVNYLAYPVMLLAIGLIAMFAL